MTVTLLGTLLLVPDRSASRVEARLMQEAVEARPAASPASAQPNVAKPQSADEKPSDKSDDKADGKPDEKSKGDDKSEKKDGEDASGVIKRPLKSDQPAAPISEEVKVTDEGMVTFDMKEQPWERVLQWLADSSQLSLDWQELPGDTLNLTTTRAYSLEEARDILNRHLLARGYAMVLNGELLSVLKTSDIKASLVPRVQPEELSELPDHTLCKVSFDLDWLIADEAVEELAPLLTKAGKINKLSRTNRLEVMDTAASLRDIYQILLDEQSNSGQEQLVKTFRLEHRRASEVIQLLYTLLGLENEAAASGGGGGGRGMGDVGQITSMMRQLQQQMQRMGNSGGSKSGGGGKEPRKTRLVLNQRENMILATAEPDQMALIDKAIAQIDVPIEASDSLLQNMNKMKVYRLQTVDPQTLVDLLQELGDMAPGTVLKVDDDKNSIVAFANLADHLTITTLVERLDQSARQIEVIPLRRLDSEYVAGTIRALMGPEQKQEDNNRYGYYSRYYGGQQEKKEDKEFKVEADIENNRLLVFANKVEMEEIHLLLQKLGEIPNPDAIDNGIRVFELSPEDDPREVMERIKRLWRRDNELQLNLPPESASEDSPQEDDSETEDADEDRAAGTDPPPVTEAPKETRPRIEVWPPRKKSETNDEDAFTKLLNEAERETDSVVAQQHPSPAAAVDSSSDWNPQRSDTSTTQQGSPVIVSNESDSSSAGVFTAAPQVDEITAANGLPPIRFSTTPDGKLIISSDDKAALQDLEDLMREVVRPAPKYKIFYLKYATPSWVTLNLEDYFKADEESESGYRYDPFWGFRPSSGNKSSGAATLGRRRQPQFIYDNFTSTILVRDADRRQLQTIEDLINIYDVPEPADTRSMRVTKIFKLQNSRAEDVAQAIKDVFRDLLSANDKALEKDGEKTQTRVYSYFGDDTEGDEDSPIRFKGLLSIGMDKNSDTLVVSSIASLMDTVSELVIELDKAAETSSSVQVIKVDPSVDLSLLQEKLNKALQLTNPQKQPQQQQGPNGQPPNGRPGRNVQSDN
ncbi:MAG: secretin N-terminal domain-containing protein [Fuerstiella sp.]